MNFSSLHFIHTIIGGLVERIPNTGHCGTPAFRFKEIGAIYSPEVANNITMPLVVGGRVTRSSRRRFGFNDGGFINEAVSECQDRWMDNRCSIDSDEDSFCEITLKELKDRCKAKRRKVSKSLDLTKQDDDFSTKQGLSNIQVKEEVSELEETLSSWKQKLLKMPKFKRKHSGKHSSSPVYEGLVKDEEKSYSFSVLAENSLLKETSQTGESCILNKIKSEVIEIESFDCQNAVYADDSSATASMEVNTADNSPAELLDVVGGGDIVLGNMNSCNLDVDYGYSPSILPERIGIELGKQEPTFSAGQFEDCCINKVSTQYIEPVEPLDILGGMSKMGFLETNSHVSLPPSTSFVTMENSLTGPFYSGNAEALSVPKDHDSRVHGFCQNNSSSNEKHFDTVAELPDAANYNFSCTELDDGRCISALESEGSAKSVDKMLEELDKSTKGSKENATDPADHSAVCGSHSSSPEFSCEIDDRAVTKLCDMDLDNGIQRTGLCNENDKCTSVSMDRKVPDKEDTVTDVSEEDTVACHENINEKNDSLCIPSQNFDMPLSLAVNFHSCNDTVPRSEKMLSSSTTNESVVTTVEVARPSFTEVPISNPTNEFAEADVCSLKQARPPEKLLSTRKVISPMSQEKLRRAAENDEFCDEIKLSKNGKNPCFEKWTTDKVPSGACFEEAEFIIKRPKNKKNSSPLSVMNGHFKASHVSCSMSCTCTQCTWISEHSQKAITFSQRQMHDIESLATRLMNGLRSMKDIIEDTLLSEACLFTPSKYTIDKIKETTEEMTVLEDSTRKWLAMMTKDCNRFCKIMTSTTTKTASKLTAIHKVQRKVTFADETGGTLCHVKILEGDSTLT